MQVVIINHILFSYLDGFANASIQRPSKEQKRSSGVRQHKSQSNTWGELEEGGQVPMGSNLSL